MTKPVYDKIGSDYNLTRSADPFITGRIYQLLDPKQEGSYLDIGCGTGNYTAALSHRGVNLVGVDPSETMLKEARARNPGIRLIQGKVEALPFPDNALDGAIAMFTLHHWTDQAQGLKELARVLKPGTPLVFLSFTPQQLDGYWLRHYFPIMIEKSKLTPDLDAMQQLLKEAGFGNILTEKYFVQDDLRDHFLYSNKYRPEQYLKPEVRNGASSFTVFAEPEEVEKGLAALDLDIRSGKIDQVIKDYENDLGDYLFIRAERL